MAPKEMAATGFTIKTKLPKTGGVYLLYCDGDEKGYIGSTNWLYRRFVIHRADLRHNRHGNPYLQRAYNKYGKASISYNVLEVCEDTTPDALIARENYYMSQVDRSLLFNLVVPAVANGTHGIRPSDAVIANLIRNNKEHKWALGLQVSDEVRAAVSARFKGKKHTPEQVAKRVQSRRATIANRPELLRGENNGRARLTEADVREIRRLYATGELIQADIGARYGMAQAQISAIVRRKVWAHVGDVPVETTARSG